MMSDQGALELKAAVRLAGANAFYTRRVLQRCERGEISLSDAAELLMAAAYSGGAALEPADVRRWLPDSLA
jgi:hypothetical protein